TTKLVTIWRGMARPRLSRRKPLSISCWMMVLTWNTSPFLAEAGITMRVVCGIARVPSSAAVDAGGDGDHDVGVARPEAAVAHGGNRRHALRVGQPDVGQQGGIAPGARRDVEAHQRGHRV